MIIVTTILNVIHPVATIRPVVITLLAKGPALPTQTVNLTKSLIAVLMTSVNILFSVKEKNQMETHVQVLKSVFLNIVTLHYLDAI